jgi:GAF domain-containing protein
MMSKEKRPNHLTEKIRVIVEGEDVQCIKLKKICKILKENISRYDWVGFYFVDKVKQDELMLGPFEGEPTEHIRIQFGQGICGQAAQLKTSYVVQDVSKEKNYLTCSPNVKSEIVIPIFKKNKIVGELDIDSHSLSAFNGEDKAFLEKICEIVSRIL